MVGWVGTGMTGVVGRHARPGRAAWPLRFCICSRRLGLGSLRYVGFAQRACFVGRSVRLPGRDRKVHLRARVPGAAGRLAMLRGSSAGRAGALGASCPQARSMPAVQSGAARARARRQRRRPSRPRRPPAAPRPVALGAPWRSVRRGAHPGAPRDAVRDWPCVQGLENPDTWSGSLRDLALRIRDALPESVSRELPRLDVPHQIRAGPTHPYFGFGAGDE